MGNSERTGTRAEGDQNVESVCMGDSVNSPGADVSAFLICTPLELKGNGNYSSDGNVSSDSVFRKCSVSAVTAVSAFSAVSAFVGAQGDSAV